MMMTMMMILSLIGTTTSFSMNSLLSDYSYFSSGALETMDTLQSGKFSIIQHVFCLSKSSDMYKNDSKQRIQWNYEINIC